MKTITKLMGLTLIAGSLSACGGGGGTVTSVADMINQPVTLVTQYDTNNDGLISVDEAVAAWDSLSQADKELLANSANLSVSQIDNYIDNLDNVDAEVAVEDIIEVIEEITPVVVEETPVVETPVVETPVVEETPIVDPTAGTYLEGVNLTEGTADRSDRIETFAAQVKATAIANIQASIASYSGIDPTTVLTPAKPSQNQPAFTVADAIAEDQALLAQYQAITVESIVALAYSDANVIGLEAAHDAGWTGLGVNVGIYDSGSHGEGVTITASVVAPGATFSYNGQGVSSGFTNQDVTNHSYGTGFCSDADAASGFCNATTDAFQLDNGALTLTYGAKASAAINANAINVANPDAVHVYAGPNSGNCPVGQTADICDGAAVAWLEGQINNTSNYIFVGAGTGTTEGYTSASAHDYTSVAVGNSITLQNQWLVADGFEVFSGAPGTSFAAPKVAGAAALVQHKFSNVNAAQTVDILLNTADDTFSGYSAFQHGQGLLDVGAALSPVGSLR